MFINVITVFYINCGSACSEITDATSTGFRILGKSYERDMPVVSPFVPSCCFSQSHGKRNCFCGHPTGHSLIMLAFKVKTHFSRSRLICRSAGVFDSVQYISTEGAHKKKRHKHIDMERPQYKCRIVLQENR